MNKENRFNNDYKKFYEAVLSIISSDNKWNPILPTTKEEQLDLFVTEWYPHMTNVSNANYSYFKDNKISPNVFLNLDFLSLMNILNDKNRIIVWEYIHSLFILSVSNSYVKQKYRENKLEEKLFVQIKNTFADFPDLVGNIVSWKRKIRNNENKKKKAFDKSFLENSKMGKLAREITQEIDIANISGLEDDIKNLDNPMKILQLLMNSDNKNKGMGKLIQTICDKLKTKIDSGTISQEELLQEATSLLGSLGGGGDNKNMGDMSSIINMISSLTGGGDNKNMPDISEILQMMQKMGGEGNNNMPDIANMMKGLGGNNNNMSDMLQMVQNLSGLNNNDDDNNSDLSGVMSMLGDLKNVRKNRKNNTGKKKKINRKMKRRLEKKLRKKRKNKKK